MIRKSTSTSSFGTAGRINHDSKKFYDAKLYKNIKLYSTKLEKDSNLPDDLINTNIHGSSEDMSLIPNNSIHLMITSPPYNVSKEYDKDLSLDEYLNLLKNVFKETYRVLVDGGRVCVNVANLGRKPYIPLSDYISKIMIDLQFNMRGEIIWNKGPSASPSTAWGSWMSASNPTLRDVHEYILVFSKGDYRRGIDKKNENRKKNTISRDNFIEWTKSIWTFNAESAKRVGHPAPFPIELPFRLIQLFSFQEDIILDPFMGSGTTGLAALKSGRKYIGFDTDKKYINLANKRIQEYQRNLEFDFNA